MALTNQDKKYIHQEISEEISKANAEQDERLVKFMRHEIREAITEAKQELHEEISHLPTKDDFFKHMDFLAGELKAIREELPALSHRVSVHDDQIQKIASHLRLAV